jgi:hypothetical protein
MDPEHVQDLKQWLDRYINRYLTGDGEKDKNILLKKHHISRVCDEIRFLGRALKLSPPALSLAEVMALFHDLGRFEQFFRYQTYSDRASVDHAQLGVAILKQENILSSIFNPGTQELIFQAITYHNQPSLPTQEREECLFFSRLLRDADKLDIWYVVTQHYNGSTASENSVIKLGFPDTPGISKHIIQNVLQGTTVSIADVRNLNDLKLLQLAWIYDLNFIPSFHRLKERGFIDAFLQTLPPSEMLEPIASRIRSFLNDKTKEALIIPSVILPT